MPCVVNCNSKKNINTNLSFHNVPKAGSSTITIKNLGGETIVVEKRSEWLKRLNIEDTVTLGLFFILFYLN